MRYPFTSSVNHAAIDTAEAGSGFEYNVQPGIRSLGSLLHLAPRIQVLIQLGAILATDRPPQAARVIENQIEHESTALYSTGRLWDDGIIHPADSRTVLGIALSAAHSNVVEGATEYGVWRH